MKTVSKFNIFLLIINILLVFVLLFSIFSLWQNRAGMTVAEEDGMSQAQETVDELDLWIENMKALAEQHGVSTYFLQELFSDKIVYTSQGHYYYADIDTTLAQNTYDWNYLSTGEDGILRYSDPNGLQGLVGIDVSKYQGEIDWQQVKDQGVQFAMLRAGYRGYETGAIMEDEFFKSYLEGATQVGIPVGLYFFSQAVSVEEAVQEADFAIDSAAGFPIQYPIVFDMEEIVAENYRTKALTASQITDIAIAFCERVRERGYTPMIYGNVGFLLGRMEFARLQDYDIWFAQYRPKPYFPYEFTMWQNTAQGQIDGIAGEVDINISFVDYTL